MGDTLLAGIDTDDAAPSPRRAARPKRRRATVTSVIGELLLTAGVVVLLFVAWQLWIGDRIIGAQKNADATAISQGWQDDYLAQGEDGAGQPVESLPEGDIPVAVAPGHAETFGVMYVPRFGSDWRFEIASGVTRTDVLDQGEIGHYPDTVMPGAMGNTAYAAHRWTSGAPFDPIDKLVVGDAIVIETEAGWYTYRFRTLEYVQDTEIDVLAAVPQAPDIAPNDRYLTLTSCAPKLNMLERIIAYAVFDDFTPRSAGPPASLTEGITT